jgi:hypothetical protein
VDLLIYCLGAVVQAHGLLEPDEFYEVLGVLAVVGALLILAGVLFELIRRHRHVNRIRKIP